MSTNFYFKLKDSIIQKMKDVNPMYDVFIPEYCDGEQFGWLHIGKRSSGWQPLFREQEYYHSVKEIKEFYEKNRSYLDIITEYNDGLTWEELEKELIDWKGERSQLNISSYHPSERWGLDEYLKNLYKDPEGYIFHKKWFG